MSHKQRCIINDIINISPIKNIEYLEPLELLDPGGRHPLPQRDLLPLNPSDLKKIYFNALFIWQVCIYIKLKACRLIQAILNNCISTINLFCCGAGAGADPGFLRYKPRNQILFQMDRLQKSLNHKINPYY